MLRKHNHVLRYEHSIRLFCGISHSLSFHVGMQLKEFILNEAEEAYEVKIGDQVFRRPGDPPLEDVLRNEKYKENGHGREDL